MPKPKAYAGTRPHPHPNKLRRCKAGDVFGDIKLIRRVRKPAGQYGDVWQVQCKCGKIEVIREQYLFRSKNPKRNCGCERKTIITEYPREYSIWKMMNKRCYDDTHVSYRYYGGAGITVYSPWRDGGIRVSLEQNVKAFGNFFRYIGPAPSAEHTLDRINGFKNYEPDNIRWATREQQARNKKMYYIGGEPPESSNTE